MRARAWARVELKARAMFGGRAGRSIRLGVGLRVGAVRSGIGLVIRVS